MMFYCFRLSVSLGRFGVLSHTLLQEFRVLGIVLVGERWHFSW